jgi:HEAT repeat protein
MRARVPATLMLAAFIAAFASARAPAPRAQDKEPPKGGEKDPAKQPEFKWPTQIGGKGLADWLKDATESNDPAVREFALKTLPGFGPDARKMCSRKLLARMRAEPDPGVKFTVFSTVATLGLEDSELQDGIVILANIVDNGAAGGLSRLHAVESLAMFGSKAEGAIPQLTGKACLDPAYVTRRTIAETLARVGFNEKSGPNLKALNRLAATLAKDESAAVRMAALQSLVLLGPPWAGPPPGKGLPGPTDWKACKTVVESMKSRLVVRKSLGIVESDKQLEIWCRVVLMRFDQKELANEEHLDEITKNLSPTSEIGPKLQALQALVLFGERAGSQVDKVVPLLKEEDPLVLAAVLGTLASMGVRAEPAIPELENTEKFWAEKLAKRKKEEDFKKAIVNLKPEEVKRVVDSLTEEQMRLATANTIKFIKDSKPGKPGGDKVGAAAAPGPP